MPSARELKSGSACKMLMDGLCFTRQKGDPRMARDIEACPTKICFPGRIFSHLLLKLDKCAGDVRIGYIFRQEMIYRVDLKSGNVEKDKRIKATFDAKSL